MRKEDEDDEDEVSVIPKATDEKKKGLKKLTHIFTSSPQSSRERESSKNIKPKEPSDSIDKTKHLPLPPSSSDSERLFSLDALAYANPYSYSGTVPTSNSLSNSLSGSGTSLPRSQNISNNSNINITLGKSSTKSVTPVVNLAASANPSSSAKGNDWMRTSQGSTSTGSSFKGSKKKHFRRSWGAVTGNSRDRDENPPVSANSRRPFNGSKSVDIEGELRALYQQKPSLLNEPDHSPTIIRNAVPPRLSDKRLKWQSSSTGTVLMNTTIKSPDSHEIVQCMALSLYYTLKKYDDKLHETKKYPIVGEDGNVEVVIVPSIEVITAFLNKIFTSSDLSAECGVMSICYIDRLLTLSGMYLLPINWRRITLGAIILASKIWEEMAVWNVDYQKVFPLLSTGDLALLEKEFLTILQFTVTLKASVYAKYYYELRALSEKDHAHFPVKPLDEDGLKKIEDRSRGLDKKRRGEVVKEKPRLTRTTSADSYEMRPRRVIIN